ncbi:MAG: hypothetical protein EOM64_01645 [Erysipelotrichia bacterium]|nr:hypothetical protein [Erysipelotrichia bacterium]
MITELGKRILECLIIHDDVVSGQKISSFCSASINTIRKEIPSLNNELSDNGCEVESRTSLGYTLVLHDRKKANPYLARMLKQIKRFSYLNLGEYSRAYFVLRFLLSTLETYSIDRLADEMFCSKSTIMREIPKMQMILDNFHLILKNQRFAGLSIEGSEFNKRMVLLYLEKTFRSLPVDERAKESQFSTALLMNIDPDLPEKLRTVLLQQLSKSEKVYLPYLYTPKVINYILFARSRSYLRDSISFTDEQLEKAKDDIVYPFAEQLFSAAPQIISNDINETDCIIISMLIQTYRSIAKSDEIPSSEYQDNLKEAHAAIEFIMKRYDISNYIDDKLYDDIAFYLYTISRSLLYEICLDKEILTPSFDTGLLSTDLCVEFGKYYTVVHHIKLPEVLIMGAYYIFNRAAMAHSYFPYKQRVCISSIYGLNYSDDIAEHLMQKYGKYISSITTVTYSHSESSDREKYDVILTDALIQNTVSNCPVIPLDFLRSPENNRIFSDYIEQINLSFSLHCFPESNFIHADCATKEDVYAAIYDHVKNDITNRDDFLKDLPMKDFYVNSERSNGMAMISSLNYSFPKPAIYLFVNKNEILWNQKLCKYFLFYTTGSGSNEDIYNISFFLKKLVHCQSDQLNQAMDEGYQSLVKNIF